MHFPFLNHQELALIIQKIWGQKSASLFFSAHFSFGTSTTEPSQNQEFLPLPTCGAESLEIHQLLILPPSFIWNITRPLICEMQRDLNLKVKQAKNTLVWSSQTSIIFFLFQNTMRLQSQKYTVYLMTVHGKSVFRDKGQVQGFISCFEISPISTVYIMFTQVLITILTLENILLHSIKTDRSRTICMTEGYRMNKSRKKSRSRISSCAELENYTKIAWLTIKKTCRYVLAWFRYVLVCGV